MSSAEPPAGGDDSSTHKYFCHHCATAIPMDPSTGTVPVCPNCRRRSIEESDRPSSSYAPSSGPPNPRVTPFIAVSPSTGATISRFASFEYRHFGEDVVHVISDNGFFSPPYPTAVPVLNPLPTIGSEISFRYLGGYIDDCLSEGAIMNTTDIQRQIVQLLQIYANFLARQAAPQAAIAALPDVNMTEDLLQSDGAQCPVCREDFKIGEVVKQLPCKHVYHKSCIVPWLEMRNSCPVCRSKLETDDANSEEQTSALNPQPVITGIQLAGSGQQNTVEQTPESMAAVFQIELLWPVEPRRFEISGAEGRQRRGVGPAGRPAGQGNGGNSSGNEASGRGEIRRTARRS
ncbi:hypothetical protein IEQ34_001038 [Dendrobium chrysotoxum]|uniref:RING-type E3 ubiquitin transferase n=1 Tax=Dendrobium chrysotoxum TaxID=161865 RepID=A0AAV7HMW4_DENCH|nr:hypothetical protein IEQ34_001038 [Dendrobium chrysotoxum]